MRHILLPYSQIELITRCRTNYTVLKHYNIKWIPYPSITADIFMLLYNTGGHFIYLDNHILYNKTLSDYSQSTTHTTFRDIVINGSLKDYSCYRGSFRRWWVSKRFSV